MFCMSMSLWESQHSWTFSLWQSKCGRFDYILFCNTFLWLKMGTDLMAVIISKNLCKPACFLSLNYSSSGYIHSLSPQYFWFIVKMYLLNNDFSDCFIKLQHPPSNLPYLLILHLCLIFLLSTYHSLTCHTVYSFYFLVYILQYTFMMVGICVLKIPLHLQCLE